MNNDRSPKRPSARAAAEAVFSKPTPKAAPAPKPPVIPGARELVSLRIDQDVLAYFQEGGTGWQERVNRALRAAAGLDRKVDVKPDVVAASDAAPG